MRAWQVEAATAPPFRTRPHPTSADAEATFSRQRRKKEEPCRRHFPFDVQNAKLTRAFFQGLNVKVFYSLPALLLLAVLALSSETHAADTRIGVWLVHSEKDPFSPRKKTIALTTSSDSGALAIRCLGDDGLSVMVVLATGNKSFDAGDHVGFKYRADEGEIVDDKGQAFGEHNIDMPNARQILTDAERAGTIYIRMDTPTATSIDLQFKTKGAAKALADIKKDCPFEPPKDGAKDEKASK